MTSAPPSTGSNDVGGGAFARNAFRVFQIDAFTYVALLVTSIVIARALGPTGMGAWAILLMIPSYTAAFGRLHVDTASVFFISTGRYRLGDISFALLVIAGLVSLLMSGAFFWWQDRLFSSLLEIFAGEKHLVFLTLAMVPLTFLAMNYTYLLQARQDFQGYNLQVLLRSVAGPIAGATGLLVLGTELEVLVWTAIGGVSLSVGYGIYRVHRAELMRAHLDLRLLSDLLAFGLKMYVGSLISFLSTYMAGLMVLVYLSTEEVGYFQIALARALLLASVATAAGTILYPRVAELGRKGSDATALTVRAFRITLLISMMTGAVSLVAAYPLVVILYGVAYVDVVPPLIILIVGVVVRSPTTLITNFFIGLDRIWVTVGFATVAFVPQVALLWIVVPRWGVPGAALATAGAWILASFVRLAVFGAVEKVPPRDLLLIRKSDFRFVYGFGVKRAKDFVHAIPGV